MTDFLLLADQSNVAYLRSTKPFPLNLVIGSAVLVFNPNRAYTLSAVATDADTSASVLKRVSEGLLEIFEANSSDVTVETALDVTPPSVFYTGFPKVFLAASGATGGILPTGATGVIVNYTVSPALPNALTLSATTGEISGTPTGATAAAANYTITALTPAARTTTNVRITVNQ